MEARMSPTGETGLQSFGEATARRDAPRPPEQSVSSSIEELEAVGIDAVPAVYADDIVEEA
jgi:hypothetical protein